MFRKKGKSILFFPINGSGIGHLTRCLAYARHLPKDWNIRFFSLSVAIDAIEAMGYEADYFLSHFWTVNTSTNWNRELAARLGLMLEYSRPDILLFDGTYPYLGLKRALMAYGRPIKVVWSRRGLWKGGEDQENPENIFHLLIRPGELEAEPATASSPMPDLPTVDTPPVTLFDREELLSGEEARRELNLEQNKKYILFSTGPDILTNLEDRIKWLSGKLQARGFTPVWLQSPLAIKLFKPPVGALLLEKYPIARHLKAFAGLVSAAGYNSCYEALVAELPTLFLPNDKLLDNQRKRALFLVENNLAVLCEGDGHEAMEKAFNEFMKLFESSERGLPTFINGASMAAQTLKELAEQ